MPELPGISPLKINGRRLGYRIERELERRVFCAKAASAYMREQGYGRIVNISSRAWLGGPGQANYSASKGGLVSLTRTLALELGRKGGSL